MRTWIKKVFHIGGEKQSKGETESVARLDNPEEGVTKTHLDDAEKGVTEIHLDDAEGVTETHLNDAEEEGVTKRAEHFDDAEGVLTGPPLKPLFLEKPSYPEATELSPETVVPVPSGSTNPSEVLVPSDPSSESFTSSRIAVVKSPNDSIEDSINDESQSSLSIETCWSRGSKSTSTTITSGYNSLERKSVDVPIRANSVSVKKRSAPLKPLRPNSSIEQ